MSFNPLSAAAIIFSLVAFFDTNVTSAQTVIPSAGLATVSLSIDSAPLKLGEMMPTDDAIDLFTKRIDGKPQDVANRVTLGRLYLRKAKEEDDFGSFHKAEQNLRQAVENNKSHLPARLYLAQSLMARHAFADALELADLILSRRPDNAVAWSIRGDCQMSLGRYDDAARSYAELLQREKSAATIARNAHLLEVRGRSDEALTLMLKARHDAESLGLSDRELAWYDLRVAAMHQTRGRLAHALRELAQSLSRRADYAPAMAAKAQVTALQGDLPLALTLYQEAVQRHGEPPMMAGLADVYQAMGKTELAEQWYEKTDQAMAEEALTAAAAHYREVAKFYCDTDRKPERALELAKEDLKLRRDVQSLDTLAFAQYRNGQFTQAAESVTQALAPGTRDANLYYHAGLILEAMGESVDAATSYREALAINPTFSLLSAPDAKRRLLALEK
ncbi:tetratricopeptide repeat protein [Planctomycetes bacterium K23_9]|uniref:Tetratricopeptide repeat protein n=1 Tax=Stieleria marina TaxID=1930275 RepID=A0A517NVT3_9BACT|nr:tetratricopeptide repeat protein [Planctomycetes bacterium K23_9]